ncbi:MAG: FAD-dependent thymidylate synthase [Ruminococcus flavefaciens]|nr:FAD-dependent thymidylate synthase [Ruminococcus flavefaciens]
MKIIKPSFEILTPIDGNKMLKHIEICGRVCYKSESRITEDSCKTFVSNIIKRGHESVLEHDSISVKFICDRGVSHEIVRHRLASYSQESTRYCNYSKNDFCGQITVIKPLFLEEGTEAYEEWYAAMRDAETHYFDLLEWDCMPQEARAVLPNSLKTEVVMTANLREWRHFFKLRCSSAAHPQMREIATPLLHNFQELIPVIFDDIAEG